MKATSCLRIRAPLGRLIQQAKGIRFPQRSAKIPGERIPQLPRASFSTQMGDLFASLSAMLLVVYKRLRHNLGISVSAVVGIIAVMAIVICVPVFANAVSSKVLREQLSEKATAK